jgi:hypothetical protein
MVNDIEFLSLPGTVREQRRARNQKFHGHADSPASPMDSRGDRHFTRHGSRLQRAASCGRRCKLLATPVADKVSP